MRSMTGYGQGAVESTGARVSVTLRAVNHRYLDLVLRLREEYRDVETALREMLGAEIHRGRVEMTVEVEPLGGRSVEVEIDEPLVRALESARFKLEEAALVSSAALRFSDLLRLSDAVRVQSNKAEWTDAERDTLLEASRVALAQLSAARCTEGAKLRAALAPRLIELGGVVEALALRRDQVRGEIAASLRERIVELAGEALDEGRLAQEVAHLVDRSDVAEELDRLGLHLEHFREVMDAEGSIGKRLDFLSQEIFRELNTVGSKCRDAEMVQRVLDGKVLCEQLREQVQNIE